MAGTISSKYIPFILALTYFLQLRVITIKLANRKYIKPYKICPLIGCNTIIFSTDQEVSTFLYESKVCLTFVS